MYNINISVSLISTEGVIIDYLKYDCIYHDVNEEANEQVYTELGREVKDALGYQAIPSISHI